MRKFKIVDLLMFTALAAVLGWPVLATLLEAFRGGAGATIGGGLIDPSAFASDARRASGPAFETVRLVLATEAIALPVGITLAIFLFRTDIWGRRFLLTLLALAVFIPMPLHAAGWLGGFGNAGRSQAIGAEPILYGWTGAAFVHAMASIPWVVLLTGVGLRKVEPELEESAWLDLPAWKVLIVLSLRRSIGAIAGSALVVAVLTAGDMTVTDLLQVRTYAEEVYVQFGMGRSPGRVALVALPPTLVLGLLVVIAFGMLLRIEPSQLPSANDRPKTWRLGRLRVGLGLATALPVGLMMGLPIFALLWRAGRVGGRAALGQRPEWSPGGLWQTLQRAAREVAEPLRETALWAAIGASIAVGLAWSLAWACRQPGLWRWLLAASVALMLAAPGPVAGMALVLAYRDVAPIYDTPMILVLGFLLKSMPFTILVLWPAIRGVPGPMLESAAVDGYGPSGQVFRVAVPLTRSAIVAAWGVAFVLSMGELPITNLIVPPGVPIVSILVWGLLHTGVESHLAGVGLVLLGAYLLAGLLAAWALGRAFRDAEANE
ncbi:N/A [soil metagenome]